MSKRAGLGKGLEALFGSVEEQMVEASTAESKQEVGVGELVPNPYQPRKVFEPEKMRELVDSIKQHGVIQPLIVRRNGKVYEIVAGERRWRAAKTVGLKEVPVVIRDYGEEEMMEVAMIENIQRHDLNPLEVAEGIKALMEKLRMTQADVAKKLGRSRTAVTNILRLLNLPAAIKALLSHEELSLGQVRPLLVIEEPENQLRIAEAIKEKGWSVRRVEEIVNEYKNGRPLKELLDEKPLALKKKAATAKKDQKQKELPEDVFFEAFRNQLIANLGTKVRIVKSTETTGKVEIEYYSIDDLERLYELFSGKEQPKAALSKKKQKFTV